MRALDCYNLWIDVPSNNGKPIYLKFYTWFILHGHLNLDIKKLSDKTFVIFREYFNDDCDIFWDLALKKIVNISSNKSNIIDIDSWLSREYKLWKNKKNNAKVIKFEITVNVLNVLINYKVLVKISGVINDEKWIHQQSMKLKKITRHCKFKFGIDEHSQNIQRYLVESDQFINGFDGDDEELDGLFEVITSSKLFMIKIIEFRNILGLSIDGKYNAKDTFDLIIDELLTGL